MTVREDEVIRSDGSGGIFGVVEKPDFTLVIPYDGQGFYVVEQYRYPVAGRYVEFPQGSWEEAADVEPLDLARAELAEETGLRAATMTYLGHLFEAYGYCNQGFHVFLATDLTQKEQSLTSEEADLQVSYLSITEFREHVLIGRVKDAPTLAAFALMQLRMG